MAKVLCTFSGQFGDILWSLPTVKVISEIVGEKVDFACMAQYESVCSLVGIQPYIEKAYGVRDWIQVHNNHGAQPWQPPAYLEKKYDRAWHLGYRGHPGINAEALPLIDFIAYQQGIKLKQPLPFLFVPDAPAEPYVSYAFNPQYGQQKQQFVTSMQNRLDMAGIRYVEVSALSWVDAAIAINKSLCFVGCRSSNWVIAHGLNKKVICYEPHPARHASGHLGKIFGNPYGSEFSTPFNAPPEICAEVAVATIEKIKAEQPEEVQNAANVAGD